MMPLPPPSSVITRPFALLTTTYGTERSPFNPKLMIAEVIRLGSGAWFESVTLSKKYVPASHWYSSQ